MASQLTGQPEVKKREREGTGDLLMHTLSLCLSLFGVHCGAGCGLGVGIYVRVGEERMLAKIATDLFFFFLFVVSIKDTKQGGEEGKEKEKRKISPVPLFISPTLSLSLSLSFFLSLSISLILPFFLYLYLLGLFHVHRWLLQIGSSGCRRRESRYTPTRAFPVPPTYPFHPAPLPALLPDIPSPPLPLPSLPQSPRR